jgi:SAM-dependent methyltransferase
MSEDRYLDATYADANPGYHVSDSAWKASQVRSLLESAGMLPRRVGDVGCGAGEVLRRLSEWLPAESTFEGWDVSPAALDLSRSREGDRIRFFEGDLSREEGRSYDVLLCLDVVEHVPDYLGFLGALKVHARAFVFHLPLDLSVQSLLRVRPILRDRAKLGHLHYFTKETALATLESAGYEAMKWVYTAGSLDLPSRSFLQSLAHGPRRAAFAISPDWTVRVLGGFSLLVLAR